MRPPLYVKLTLSSLEFNRSEERRLIILSQVSQAASLQRFSVAEQVNVGYVFEL